MKISELVSNLEKLKNDHGDLDVVKFYDGFCDPIDTVKYEEVYISDDGLEHCKFKDPVLDAKSNLNYEPYIVI